MNSQIIDGKEIAQRILDGLKTRISALRDKNIIPRLAVFLVGYNAASESYVAIKQKRAREIGVEVEVKKYPENVAENELINAIKGTTDVSGILVQLPLPARLDKQKVQAAIDPRLDVEAKSPAARAIRHILGSLPIDLETRNILIIGTGELVGNPLAEIFKAEGLRFLVANRQTENLSELTNHADVLITATGQPGLIRGEMIKEGAVVIDAGTAESEKGTLVGDVDFESVAQKASYISPVPGGVGPVTVAMLLSAVVDNAESKL